MNFIITKIALFTISIILGVVMIYAGFKVDFVGPNATHFKGLKVTDKNVGVKTLTYVIMLYLGVGHASISPQSSYANMIVIFIMFSRFILISDILIFISNNITKEENISMVIKERFDSEYKGLLEQLKDVREYLKDNSKTIIEVQPVDPTSRSII